MGLKEPWSSQREAPLSHSFCAIAVRERKLLVVNDAREHPVLRNNLTARELDMIAYAGVPLVVDDEAIGTLAVFDGKPRVWKESDIGLLQEVAESVVSEIELRKASRAAIQQRALTDAIIESLGDGVLAIDTNRRFLIANQAARRVFAEGAEVGMPLPPESGRLHRSMRADGTPLASEDGALVRALRGQDTDGLTFTLQEAAASQPVWVEATGRPVRDPAGQVIAGIAIYRELTANKLEGEDLRRARDLLERERTLLGATLENVDDGVMLVDADRRIVFANRSSGAMFGLPKEQLEGMTQEQFFGHVAGLVDDAAAFIDSLVGRKHLVEDYVLARPRRRILQRAEAPVSLPTGDAALVTWHDVTADRDLVAERERQLLVDALTGIPNRRAAQAALSVEDSRRKRSHAPLSVAIFDIDHFKEVNDAFGFSVGDEVLRSIAATLAAQARLTDLVARWGGEEFLAVLPGPLDGGVVFCERARKAVEKIRCAEIERVTISVGVAEVAHNETLTEAIARADDRLYEAKRSGRNRVKS
jgi:diguanylate cyclase (GGDEF)-like protein/PAS domain S-box-containing protein